MELKMKNRRVLVLFLLLGALCVSHKSFSQNNWELEKCIEYALEHNIQVKQEKLNTELSSEDLKSSKADFLPSLNGNANVSRSYGRSVDQYTNEISDETRTTSRFGISSRLVLFNGMSRLNRLKRNRFSLQSTLSSLESVKNDIAVNVASAYLNILLNKQLKQEAQKQLDVTEQQVEVTEKLVEAGKQAKSNFLEIQAQAAQERLNLVQAKNSVNNSVLQLTQLLELDSVGDFSIVTPEFTMEDNKQTIPSVNTVYAQATEVLPRIQAAHYNVKAREKSIDIAKSRLTPSLTLSASYSTGYSDFRQLYDTTGDVNMKPVGIVENSGAQVVSPQPVYESQNYPFFDQVTDNAQTSLQLSLNIPIFNNLDNNTAITKAKIQHKKAKHRLEQEKNQLRKSIQQAHADAMAALEKYQAAKKNVASRREAFNYAEERFNLGLINSVDYNTSKNNFARAKSEMLQAKFEFLFKRLILEFYQGKPIQL